MTTADTETKVDNGSGEIVIRPEISKPYEELKIRDEIEVHYGDKVEIFTVVHKRTSTDGTPLISMRGYDIKFLVSNKVGVSTPTEDYELITNTNSGWITVSIHVRVFLMGKNENMPI